MKIRIITHDDERIIVKHTIIKLGVNPFDTEGSKVPISLFKDKGDILAAKGASNPATIKAGSDGQVLVSDSNEEAGVKWQTQKIGTITLLNSESATVPSAIVVTPGTASGTFRVAKSSDTENLYVTSENILSGKYGVLYATSGVSCSVRVTEGAITIGDKLAVSATDGVAETTTGTYFAIAVTGKSAGEIGTISCILVNQNISTLPISQGGTGATTAAGARINLGILDACYPVGSIYMSVNPTNPSNYFGGTWVAWGAGRVPVGYDSSQSEFDTVGKTGGEKAHTLITAEMPSHNHGITISKLFVSTDGVGGCWVGDNQFNIAARRNMTSITKITSWVDKDNLENPPTIDNVGSGGAHNNLQPYITCYMWKRTA